MSTAIRESAERPRVIAVLGPTAVGKSDLAERLAKRLDGEIISADSMQVYRGMDIGTAKPSTGKRAVPYHCLDLADPGTPFSAALFQNAARSAIVEIAQRHKVPILCGGTGLYARAALDDWEFPGGQHASPERQALERDAESLGPAVMHARLAAVDPRAAALIHPANVRRTIRALEMSALGDSYTDRAERFSVRRSVYDTAFIGLTMERESLYRRIDARVDAMLSAGLLAEVESLLAAGLRDALTAAQAIGYKELVPVIESGAPLEAAIKDMKRATRRYAKRQLTWFRGDPRIRWIDVTGLDSSESVLAAVGLLESEEAQTGVPAAGTWRLTAT